jgi:hypothetical protein
MAFRIPEHVRAYVRDVFGAANRRVATKICRMPTTHEESLDMALVEELSEHAAPVQLVPAHRGPDRFGAHAADLRSSRAGFG